MRHLFFCHHFYSTKEAALSDYLPSLVIPHITRHGPYSPQLKGFFQEVGPKMEQRLQKLERDLLFLCVCICAALKKRGILVCVFMLLHLVIQSEEMWLHKRVEPCMSTFSSCSTSSEAPERFKEVKGRVCLLKPICLQLGKVAHML